MSLNMEMTDVEDVTVESIYQVFVDFFGEERVDL